MPYRPLLYSFSLTAALLGAALPAHASDSNTAPSKKYRQAQDMAYGVALYDYFQGNYFDALSTLMVAEERDTIRIHTDNAALIEGGISLGFGLQERAAELFEQQLQVDRGDPETLARYRAVAWLKLAELNYRQQNWPQAKQQLQKSGAANRSDLALNLALRDGDFAAAEQRLASETLPLKYRLLGRINLAAALARQQRFGEAITQYGQAAGLVQELGETEPELQILRDKAHIGAGYAFALQQRFPQAMEEFRQVRLRTAWADRALLGLGWSAINSERYRAAVDALQFLLEQHSDSGAAREALVALPYSYEKLQRPKAALLAYQQAEQNYRSTLTELQQLQSSVSALAFAPAVDPERARFGWLEVAEAPQLIRDNRRYLQQILQSDHFQLRLSELRDLKQLAQVIARWQEQLPLFGQLLDARKLRRKEIVDGYNSAQYDQQVDIARQEYRALKNTLARIEEDRDGLALLATEEGEENEDVELLNLLQRAEARHAQLASLGKTREYQRKTLQRARGILQWQAAQDYHDNLWQKHKTLRALEEQLSAADKQRQQVDRISSRAPQLRQLQHKAAAAQPQLAQQSRAIVAASAAIESSIRRDVIAELHRQRAQIQQYMAHSRLAIARLQDAAMQESTVRGMPLDGTAPPEESTGAGGSGE